MSNDDADHRYDSVNMAENDSSPYCKPSTYRPRVRSHVFIQSGSS